MLGWWWGGHQLSFRLLCSIQCILGSVFVTGLIVGSLVFASLAQVSEEWGWGGGQADQGRRSEGRGGLLPAPSLLNPVSSELTFNELCFHDGSGHWLARLWLSRSG